MDLKLDNILKAKWELYENNPVISPPVWSPIIADPTFLTPEQTHDSQWKLFAHSILGIHRYYSKDGFHWKDGSLKILNGMRPFLLRENNEYILFYERYRNFQLPFSWLHFWKWRSYIEFRHSKNLHQWSKPIPVLYPRLSWHSSKYGHSVSNPCVVYTKKEIHLYYSAALTYIPDCGFCEPTYIGLALAKNLEGPYSLHPEPILFPESKNEKCNLACGSLKVITLSDGFLGFQNAISIHKGKSISQIYVLFSEDGLKWDYIFEEPILAPSEGWMGSHIYAMDVKYSSSMKSLVLFFNARDKAYWTVGKEKIGILFGRLE
ncbi:MAG: glycosyl hydrolase family 43 [Leptospiraceae bacterium]|nr:glycosyl hydrolase family 43 [Leptospiraceae bacterium]